MFITLFLVTLIDTSTGSLTDWALAHRNRVSPSPFRRGHTGHCLIARKEFYYTRSLSLITQFLAGFGLSSSVPSVFFSPLLNFHSLFTAFYESFVCNYNVSNIIINIYEKHWLSEINLSQKIYSRSLNHWFLFRFSQHLHSFEPHKLNFMAVAFFLIIFLKSEI